MNLEKEYSPSFNTNRFQDHPCPNEAVIQHFVDKLKEQTEEARFKYEVHEDVRYGGEDDNQLLDIYYKDSEMSSPIFVFIHGGYWQCLDKSTSGSFVQPLINRGFRIIAVDYNLCPGVTLNDLSEQIINFFKWLSEYALKTKAKSISLAGHSAGAHLLTILLKHGASFDVRISSIFLISGIFDLREMWKVKSVNPNNALGLDVDIAENLSPICWNFNNQIIKVLKKFNIEFHVLVAENDSETFIKQSRDFAQKLKENNFENVNFQIFENYDHFNIIEEVNIDGSNINKYIMKSVNSSQF